MTEVGEIMSAPVFAISVRDNLARARNLMLRKGISRLAVIDGDILKGIVTKKDLGIRLSQAEPRWRRRPLDQIPIELVMTPNPLTIPPEMSIREAASLLLDNGISSLIVYKDATQGIVTKHDLVRFFTMVGCPLRVGDMMSRNVVTVSRHHTINSVIDIMYENGTDKVVVTNGTEAEAYIGVITLDDLGFVEMDPRNVVDIKEARKSSYAGPRTYRAVREAMLVAEDVMASPIVYTSREAMAIDAAKTMEDNNFDMLPVINGKLVGQFTYENILKWLSEAPE